MPTEHIENDALKIFAQNTNGNFEFEILSDKEFNQIKNHIALCVYCKKNLETYAKMYKEIESVTVSPNRSFQFILSAAAILLCAFSFLTMGSNLNSDKFIQLHEFNFKITRGVESNNTSNEIIYQINEKQYDKAIELCKQHNLTENNLLYAAALVLKAQTEDDPILLKKATSSLSSDQYTVWNKRINQIME